MADLEDAFRAVCEIFNIIDLNSYQKEALRDFVSQERDVFVSLPTGTGKSMIYLALPTIFDFIRNTSGHIVVVVSPLVNLMFDQVSKLRTLGIAAVSLSNIEEEEIDLVEQGKFSVVYGTPESWLKNERWRKLLSSKTYESKLCAIAVDEAHVIKQWGTSNNNKMAAFRESYGRLHEMRALATSSVRLLALTATATKHTRNVIMEVLMMDNPCTIYESPGKTNIAYSVCYMKKDVSVDRYFQWLGNELKEFGKSTTRTIIYCQTIKQCTLVYCTIKAIIGNKLFTGEYNDRKKVLVEMLHSCTPEENKQTVLNAFQHKDSDIRVLVATIAFGMWVDCKGVYRTIHFGPSKNVESYIQESGRAGRDQQQSVSYILYQGLMLNHVDRDIKKYLDCNGCRRLNLLDYFDLSSEVQKPMPLHLCCDICAKECSCGDSNCGELVKYPGNLDEGSSVTVNSRTRNVSGEQLETVYSCLAFYHKSLLKELLRTYHHSHMKLSAVKFLLGFSELQIEQVVENCDKLFNIDDVLNLVEVWDLKHANKILEVIVLTFGDTSMRGIESNDSTSENASESEDDDVDTEWDDLFNDDELFDLAMENLSSFLLDNSVNESFNNSNTCELPNAAAHALEHLSLVSSDNVI